MTKQSEKKGPEDFVHLHGFPGYAVTRSGQVWSQRSGQWRVLKPRCGVSEKYANNLPYLAVALYVDKRRFDRPVHKLILEAFRGPAPKGLLARHVNGKCQDNRLSNLRWGTPGANQRDRLRHGTDSRGEKGREAVVSNAIAKRIRKDYGPLRGQGKRGVPTMAQIAKKYGLNPNTVSGIIAGRRYV